MISSHFYLVRDNILFGLPFDEKRYADAIHACCLEADFEQFVDGDATGIKFVLLFFVLVFCLIIS
jgi:hypothetical protein